MTWCEQFGWFETYDRLEQTWIGVAIRESLWLFPGIEAVHLLGLAVIGGSILVVDLRLLGVGLTRLTTGQVLATARPWFIGALILMFATGVPLFLSEAVKCCFNDSFEVKMAALATGNRVHLRDQEPRSGTQRCAGVGCPGGCGHLPRGMVYRRGCGSLDRVLRLAGYADLPVRNGLRTKAGMRTRTSAHLRGSASAVRGRPRTACGSRPPAGSSTTPIA